jgi:uncharacterized protein (TIGR03067 family)
MNAPLSALVALYAATAIAPLALATADPAPRDENAALQGSWVCASAVVDGKPLPEKTVKQLRLTISADRYKTERTDEVLFDSTYRLDPSKEPKQIEMTATEGDAAGRPALGIYAVDGDTLKMCYVMPDLARPKSFDSAAGSKAFLVMWKRVPDGGAAPGVEKRPEEDAPAESEGKGR